MTAKKTTLIHGTLNGYAQHRCRCDECRAVKRAIMAAHYAKHRDAMLARARQIRAVRTFGPSAPIPHGTLNGYNYYKCRCDECKAAKKIAGASEYAAHVDRYRTYGVGYARANSAVAVRRSAEWRQANPGRYRALMAANSARRRSDGSIDMRDVSDCEWTRLCARFAHRCAYCGKERPLTQDHVIPIARGGRHAIGNLLPACRPCNTSKKDHLLVEWRVKKRRASK